MNFKLWAIMTMSLVALFMTPAFALGDCPYGQIANVTNTTFCEPIICDSGFYMNQETQLCQQNQIIKNDCPAPSLTTGIVMITYAPKDSNGNPIFTKGKTYMFATYWKERWNTKVFITESELTAKMKGFTKLSYRQTTNSWAFSKWRYD